MGLCVLLENEVSVDEFVDSNVIRIQGLPDHVSFEEICSYFSVFGSILSIKKIDDVILAFASKTPASNALKLVGGKSWKNQTLMITKVRPIDPFDDVIFGMI